jgi:RND superfamily putative drug exporter
VAVNPAKTVARIDMPLAGNGEDAVAYHALNVLRHDVIPPVLATMPSGTQALVTGDTAGSYDFNQTMKHRIWYVFAFVLGLAFLLLLLAFRSIGSRSAIRLQPLVERSTRPFGSSSTAT